MTKLKTGDRVVPGPFKQYQCTNDMVYPKPNMIHYYGIEGDITEVHKCGCCTVHGIDWPPSALTPVKPKWEPKVGDEIVTTRLNRKDKIRKIQTIYHTENQDGYFERHEIEKYKPTPEDEIGSILCKLIGGDNYILRDAKADIMAFFNRHKEGEGR